MRPALRAALAALVLASAVAGGCAEPRPVDDKDGPWPPVLQPLVAERTLPIVIGVRPFRAAAQMQPTFEPFVGLVFPSTALPDRLKAARETGLPAAYAVLPREPSLSVVERPSSSNYAGPTFDVATTDVGRDAGKACAGYLRAAQLAREVKFGTDFDARAVDLVVEGWVVDLRSSAYVDRPNIGIVYLIVFTTAGLGYPLYHYLALDDYIEGRVHLVLVARRPGEPKPVAWTAVAHDWSKAFPVGEGAIERERVDQAAVREALGICFREFLDDLQNVGGVQNLGAAPTAPKREPAPPPAPAPAKSPGGAR